MLWNATDRTSVTGNIRAYFWPASITVRLTWLYTLTVVAVLCTCAFFTYGSLVRGLERKDTAAIASEADHIVTLLKDNPALLGQYVAMTEWDKTGHSAKSATHHARVCDEAGRVIAQSPFFATPDPAMVFPSATSTVEGAKKWRSADGRPFLLMAVSAQEGDNPKKTRIIQVAADVSDNDAIT
ncbi:MAG TPA: hypothetical protein VK187_05260, partial [Geobacteraceae bacterium]|nr:hypothetical protein [Geobacteraceae bacterium]